MTASTCRDCATQGQIEEITKLVYRAGGKLTWGKLDEAYQLISDAKTLLDTVIAIKKEL